jgi:hypothetical protein
MKFNEAMESLQKGLKVTRQPWIGSIYFLMDGNDVKSYQPRLAPYNYNEDVMISDGWIVESMEGEYKFYDIIDYLQKGLRAYMKNWKESYIYLDKSSKALVIHSMEIFPFIPEFSSFIAQDWVVIE